MQQVQWHLQGVNWLLLFAQVNVGFCIERELKDACGCIQSTPGS